MVDIDNCDINIFFYQGYVTQIITNLITNSLKYAFNDLDSGKIVIKAAIENANLLIYYSDNGIGIEKEKQEKIYDWGNTSDPSNSTGRGLSIIKMLITKMKGNISLKSDLGKGVNFVITLPI
jgi:signal transduction histidine kinase